MNTNASSGSQWPPSHDMITRPVGSSRPVTMNRVVAENRTACAQRGGRVVHIVAVDTSNSLLRNQICDMWVISEKTLVVENIVF